MRAYAVSALPVGSSWSVGPRTVAKVNRKGKAIVRQLQKCAYCGKPGHNLQTCTLGGLPQLKTRLALLQADKNPFEWERLRIAKDALRLISRSKGRDTASLRKAASIGLAALGGVL